MFFFWIRSEEVLSHRIYVGNSISQSDKESPIVKSPWDKVWFSAFLLLLSSVIESSQISISFQFVKLREWNDQNIQSASESVIVSDFPSLSVIVAGVLVVVWRLSERCLEGVWRVSGVVCLACQSFQSLPIFSNPRQPCQSFQSLPIAGSFQSLSILANPANL